MKHPDDNDRARAGTLPANAFTDTVPVAADGSPATAPSPSAPAGSVGSVGSVVTDATSWPPLLRFGLEEAPVPFPVEALPTPIAEWVKAEALMLQCPEDLPAILAIGVGALAVAKKRFVRVNPRWSEPLNQYRVAGLQSGESKSPAYDDAIAPLRTWERDERRRLSPIYDRAHREQAARQARIKHLQKQAAKLEGGADRDELTEEIAALVDELRAAPRVRLPKLFCEDVTPEQLAVEFQNHGGRMGILSDEGGPFEMMLGRYSDSPRLEVYLKAYSGSLLQVDRKGLPGCPVPSLRIERPTLTMVLTVQPCVIEGLASKKEMRTRGMLARFAYSIPASRVGSRAANTAYVPGAVAEEYAALMTRLVELTAPENEEAEYQPIPISLSPQAWAQLNALKTSLEPRMGPGCDLAPMQDWVNKHWGRVLRTAGLLHLAGLQPGSGQAETAVTGEEMERAVLIGEYDLAHARRAFASMAEPESIADGRALLAWVVRRGRGEFQERDAHRGMEHRFPRVEGVRSALRVLQERGYVRLKREEEGGPRAGRPPSPVYEVHPDLLTSGSLATQPTEPTEPHEADGKAGR